MKEKLLGILGAHVAAVLGVSAALLALHIAHSFYKERKINRSTAGSGHLFVNSFLEAAAFLFRVFPKVIVCILIFDALAGIVKVAGTAFTYFENEKRIKELKAVVRNLARAEDLVKIELAGVLNSEFPYECRYRLTFFCGGKEISREYVLKGSEIFLDFMNINFDYSEIEAGKTSNVAYPYRIFSDVVPPERGIKLGGDVLDAESNVPVTFLFSDVYGIEKETYIARAAELFGIAGDEKKSREMGIRSSIGTAPHVSVFDLAEGQIFSFRITNTGGVSVHTDKEREFLKDFE